MAWPPPVSTIFCLSTKAKQKTNAQILKTWIFEKIGFLKSKIQVSHRQGKTHDKSEYTQIIKFRREIVIIRRHSLW